MTKLQGTIRQYLSPILLLLLAGGFLVILGELVLYKHWDGTQLIGFSATIIGLVAVLLGLFAKGGLRIALAVVLAVISLSGLIGTYEHYQSRNEEGEAARPALQASATGKYFAVAYNPSADKQSVIKEEGEEGEKEGQAAESGEAGEAGERGEAGEGGGGGEEVPPPLAPLSLAGLSLMGAAVLFAKQD